ncbi:MAG: orotidine-5'-phosphate decarboxylase [Chloroflexi bacterium]|nr:orotidine-5'-phosphate decarboxylase [Chloroflexota bacterium]
MSAFVTKLLAASERNRSLLCVGLDPDPALMPREVTVADFNRSIIEATKDLVCAYKPNLAFYEALGFEGWQALRATLDAIPKHIPVIGDGKRGDVPNTAQAYAKAMFDVWGFDSTTVNPYLGMDTIDAFAAYKDKGVFLLCRTSNPGSGDFQGLPVPDPREASRLIPLYEHVALRMRVANIAGNFGLVVGVTHPEELRRVRELCPDMPILILGVGPQGGDLETAVRYGVDAHGRLAIINASRQVLYASRGRDFAEAARRQALALRDTMQAALASKPA